MCGVVRDWRGSAREQMFLCREREKEEHREREGEASSVIIHFFIIYKINIKILSIITP